MAPSPEFYSPPANRLVLSDSRILLPCGTWTDPLPRLALLLLFFQLSTSLNSNLFQGVIVPTMQASRVRRRCIACACLNSVMTCSFF